MTTHAVFLDGTDFALLLLRIKEDFVRICTRHNVKESLQIVPSDWENLRLVP